jgi:hypothetical protein
VRKIAVELLHALEEIPNRHSLGLLKRIANVEALALRSVIAEYVE